MSSEIFDTPYAAISPIDKSTSIISKMFTQEFYQSLKLNIYRPAAKCQMQ